MEDCIGNAPPASVGGHRQHQDNPASSVLADGVAGDSTADSTKAAGYNADAQPAKELPETEAPDAQASADAAAAAAGVGAVPPPSDLPIDGPAAPPAPPAPDASSAQFDDAGSKSKSTTITDPSPLVQTWAASIPHPPPPPPSSGPRPAAGPDLATPTPASHTHDPSPLPDIPHIVAPSSYLRQRALNRTAMAALPEQAQPQPPPQPSVFDKEQSQGLRNIREFLKVRTGYDVFPLSFRLIVMDHDLLIKKSLNIMIQNSIVSAPLWDSHTSRFSGILTATDYINVIQYYCQFPEEMSKLESFRLSSLRDIEKAIGAIPIENVSVHPLTSLYDACTRMLKTRARRIPLVDIDDETGREWVVSVITQYRILKFIAVNNEHNTVLFKRTVRELGLGSYTNLSTTRMNNSVLDVIHQLVERNISCVPVVDEHYRVLNVFEAVDVIPCIKGGLYEELSGTIGEALCKRSDDSPGIYTCSEHDRLGAIFDTIRKSRVHRLIVVDDDNRLKGVIALSDILKYVLHAGDGYQ